MASRRKMKEPTRPLFEETIDTTEEVASPSDGGTPISATSIPYVPEDMTPLSSPRLTQPDPTPVPTEVPDGTSGDVPEEEYTREMMVNDLRTLFGPPTKRRALTLVDFPNTTSNTTRYVLIDVNDGLFDEGWKMYREKLDGDEEGYLTCVYDALSMPVPRLYTNVVPYRLRK